MITRIVGMAACLILILGGLFWYLAQQPINSTVDYSSTAFGNNLIPNDFAVRDIPYCDGDPKQTYDLYLPSEMTESTPVIIYIHGGGWHTGDKKNDIVNYYGKYFVKHGFVFASVNYRLAPKFRYPTQNNDVACAIHKIASTSSEYGIDPSRTILFGDSAGGLLASMYALTEKSDTVKVRGVVSFYGTTDLVYQLNRTSHRNTNAQNYLGSASDTVAQKASPLYQKIVTVPPFLFYHGDKDTMVTQSQARSFYERIVRIEPKSRFVSVKNANHHFDDTTSPKRSEIRDDILEFIFERLADLEPQNSGTVVDEENGPLYFNELGFPQQP